MNYHHLPYDEVLKQVDSRHDGLSEAEAADRLAQNGKNALIEAKKKPAIVKFDKKTLACKTALRVF